MYYWIDDKEFLKKLRFTCSGIVNELVQLINSEGEITVRVLSAGSGARNMETQNNNEAVDLDYNLEIIECYDINDCYTNKEYIRKSFNKVLNRHGWSDCKDSTSVLTTEQRVFSEGNDTPFSIDLAIVTRDEDGTLYRLIHNKTGIIENDNWYWNKSRDSKGIDFKANKLKKFNLWEEVREKYLYLKNLYLSRNDQNHPSFVCYIEAVNEIYNNYFKN